MRSYFKEENGRIWNWTQTEGTLKTPLIVSSNFDLFLFYFILIFIRKCICIIFSCFVFLTVFTPWGNARMTKPITLKTGKWPLKWLMLNYLLVSQVAAQNLPISVNVPQHQFIENIGQTINLTHWYTRKILSAWLTRKIQKPSASSRLRLLQMVTYECTSPNHRLSY